MKKYFLIILSLVVVILAASCSSNPYGKTNRMHKRQAKDYGKQLRTFPPAQSDREKLLNYGENWVGTTNFNLRKPNYVVLHHTAQNSVDHTLQTFTQEKTSVSAHYVIGKDGKIFHMLNDYYRAWHGGVGKWGNNTDLNSSSIGIELDNNGFEPFTEEQIQSLIKVLGILKEKYSIPTANFIGHSDIAPSRKVDPNVTFPWKRLAEEGFGYWYDDIAVSPKIVGDSIAAGSQDNSFPRSLKATESEILEKGSSGDTLTLTINPEIALRLIGYDTSNLEAAIKAFKLHFIQKDINAVLTEEDLKILYNLSKKYL